MKEKVLLIQGWTWALDMSRIIDFCCFMAQSEVFSGFPEPVPAHITSEKHSLTLKLLLQTLSSLSCEEKN